MLTHSGDYFWLGKPPALPVISLTNKKIPRLAGGSLRVGGQFVKRFLDTTKAVMPKRLTSNRLIHRTRFISSPV